MSHASPRIVVDGVSKSFRIPIGAPATLKHRVLHPLQRTEWRRFDALREVSLEVADGEFFGIVGRNGCGKSTLLKMLAGIYQTDAGRVTVRGRLAPLIELGVGFNQELSARDNVFINGTLLGMTAGELRRRLDEIVEFAELDGFMDLKLRNFSSGMVVRLAFAVAVLADADILLADEVLAVGDERFQQKCYDVFRKRKQAGQTVVFVTHDMDAMQQFCDQAMLLERGANVITGDPRLVARAYSSINAGLDPEQAVQRAGGSAAFELSSCTINGQRAVTVQQGGMLEVAVAWIAHVDVVDPVLSLSVTDRYGQYALRWNTLWSGQQLGCVSAGERVEATFRLENQFAAGLFSVAAGAAAEDGHHVLGIVDNAATFRSLADTDTGGIVDLPVEIDLGVTTGP